jgi:CDP-4-dehydro-6-deoxyglucose reductase, E3
MPHRITIQPSNHEFTANDGETLLEAALREGYVIAYGCRNGACGTCKGKVVAGKVDYGRYQEHALPEPEKMLGLALFCQARALTDLTVECREIGSVKDFPIRTLPCRVQNLRRAAEDVMVLHVKLPASERLQFHAGQYIDILMKGGERRSLSLANPPHDDALLELHLRDYGGPFSNYVFRQVKEKDILRFEGPLGTFFLREDSNKPIIMVAGGTGFAPVKAIIEHAHYKKIERTIMLYWGARTKSGLYMNALAERWAREYGLTYVPVLSEPAAEDDWRGRTGLVHQAVMADFPDLSAHQVYACGAPAMVDAAHLDFTTRCRLPEDELYSDAFTPAAPSPA